MKRTLFITMLAAALFGSAYANTNYTTTPGAAQTNPPGYIYGTYADTGDVSGGSVDVFKEETDTFFELGDIFGGYTGHGKVSGCTTTMEGGRVDWVYGGYTKTGDATGDTATITGGTVFWEACGGWAESGNAIGNTATISGGTVERYMYGGYAKSGNASENVVTISGGHVTWDAYGGYSLSGDVSENSVTMTGGKGDVYGALSDSGDATGNTVTLSGSFICNRAFGGLANSGNASGNAVTVSGSAVNHSVCGGYSSGDAIGNTVTVYGVQVGSYYTGSYAYHVHGGLAGEGNAIGNIVTMYGGEVGANMYGGYVNSSGDATDNTVTLSDSNVSWDLYGGYTYSGNAIGNTVNMTGGEVGRDMYGGYAKSGDASDNTVTISGVIVEWNAYGGYVSGSGDATGNAVTVTGGEVQYVYGGYVDGSGDATDNTVTMDGGEAGFVLGGYVSGSGNVSMCTVFTEGAELAWAVGGETKSGNASENIVTMYESRVKYSYGGYVSGSGDAFDNTVTISGCEVGDYVRGGLTVHGNSYSNSVTVNGGVICNQVVGGKAGKKRDGSGGSANNNSVALTNVQPYNKPIEVFGGYGEYDAYRNSVTVTGSGAMWIWGGYALDSDASDNMVSVTESQVTSVIGGKSEEGDACGNTVTIADTTVSEERVVDGIYGGYAEQGDANNNTVTMTGGQAEAVEGGYGTNANGNTVTVTDATIEYEVYGGTSVNSEGVYSGTANDNTVTMNGGQVETICAARGYSTIGNTVVMNGGQTGSILAGSSYGGENSGNTVIVTEGVVRGGIGGGYLYNDGELRDNRVYLVGKGATATIGGKQYTGGAGGIQAGAIVAAMADEEAYHYVSSGNSIDVYGTGTTAGMVGYMEALTFHLGDGLASAGTPMLTITDDGLNLVIAKLGFRGDDVTDWSKFEGRSITLVQAADNVTGVDDGTEVNITGEGGKTLATATLSLGSGNALVLNFSGVAPTGQTSYTANPGSPQTSAPDTIYGAYAETGDVTGGSAAVFAVATGGYESLDYVYGGYAKSGNVSGCTATMDSGSATWVYGGYTNSGDVSGNTVTMAGGEVGSKVSGGCAAESGDAIGNTVIMTGGEVGTWLSGGYAPSGDAIDNTVTMTGGKVGSYVFGGYTLSGNVSDNTVTMSGGEVHWDVYGGSTASGNATGNTVRLVGKGASYTIGKTVYQGSKVAIQYSVKAGACNGGSSSLNNSVDIHGTGISIGRTIDYCQRMNFYLVQDQAGGAAEPMVTLGGNDGRGLDLEGVELGFHGDAVTNWAAFKGKSVTLVSMTNESIMGLVAPADSVDITDGAGETVATATLTLSGDQTKLYLSDIQGVGPVPPPVPGEGPDALDVALVNSLWASSAYVREFVRLSEAQGYALKDGDTAVWGGGFGTFMHTTGNKGFKSNGGGYGIGVNHAFSANTYAGISLGQGFGSYHNSGADGATVHQRATLAAATASTRITKDLSLGGHLAFGNVRNRADCRLDGASERSRWNDNVFNLGARAAYDFHVTETTAITPFLGLDWMNGAHESFTGGYGRHYSHGRLNELRMPVGVTVSTSVEVGSTKLLPQLSVAYVPSLAQQLPQADVSGENGDYRVKGYAPGRNAFMLNVGVNAVFSDTWSAGAFYTLETRRHSVNQSVNASVRYTF